MLLSLPTPIEKYDLPDMLAMLFFKPEGSLRIVIFGAMFAWFASI